MERVIRTATSPATGRLVGGKPGAGLLLLLLLCLLPLACREDNQGSPGEDNPAKDKFRIIPAAEVLDITHTYLYTTPGFYLLFLVGPAGFLLTVLLKQRKKNSLLISLILFSLLGAGYSDRDDTNVLMNQGVDRYLTGDIKGALEAFTLATEILPENAYLQYNLALCHYSMEETGKAIFHLKQAQRLDCREKRVASLLRHIEDSAGLNSQVDSNPHFHPDIPLILTLVFYTAVFVLLSVMLHIKKGQLSIALILCATFSLLCLGVFVYEQVHTHKKIGVIDGGLAPIKQIPEEIGMAKINLKEGTIVQVLWQFEDTYFIRTGRGLKGWVKKKHLLR